MNTNSIDDCIEDAIREIVQKSDFLNSIPDDISELVTEALAAAPGLSEESIQTYADKEVDLLFDTIEAKVNSGLLTVRKVRAFVQKKIDATVTAAFNAFAQSGRATGNGAGV